MKKFLVLISVSLLISECSLAMPMNPTPNVGNMEFYPLMQYQMEKQETLDFVNDSENYKKKRKAKDNESNIKSNFDPNYAPNYGINAPIQPVNMQFTQDENGNIKIQNTNK